MVVGRRHRHKLLLAPGDEDRRFCFAATGALGQAIKQWGFVPDDVFRHGGLTLVTSFFLHAGIWHLIGNMYFFLLLADNVEDHLGRSRFLLLLAAAHVAGMVLHAAFDPRGHVPCVGASAGISGVIAYYAVVFPHAKLGFLLRWFLLFRWIRMPAYVALVLYLVLQLIGAWAQVSGFSSVSALGHLGGLGVGLAVACAVRLVRARYAAAA